MSDRATIVIPYFYNSSTIEELLAGLINSPGLCGRISEFIIIDDGSKESSKIREAMFKCGANGKIVELKSNAGQRQSTILGVQMAESEWICTIDADLQFKPDDLSRMFEMRSLYKGKMLGGSPIRTKNSAPRLFLSDMAWLILRLMVLRRYQAGFAFTSLRMIHREFIDTYGVNSIYHVWEASPTSFEKISVGHFPRSHDDSRYSIVSLLRFSRPYILLLLRSYLLLWSAVFVLALILLPFVASVIFGFLTISIFLIIIWPQNVAEVQEIIFVS
jgi:glycosyltransferase involved in cell wall biosynthesis